MGQGLILKEGKILYYKVRGESKTLGTKITVALAELDSRGFGLQKGMGCINVYALGPKVKA